MLEVDLEVDFDIESTSTSTYAQLRHDFDTTPTRLRHIVSASSSGCRWKMLSSNVSCAQRMLTAALSQLVGMATSVREALVGFEGVSASIRAAMVIITESKKLDQVSSVVFSRALRTVIEIHMEIIGFLIGDDAAAKIDQWASKDQTFSKPRSVCGLQCRCTATKKRTQLYEKFMKRNAPIV